jgi:hypothetical protein
VTAFACFPEFEYSAAGDDFAAMAQEGIEYLL